MIDFACPHCGHPMHVKDEHAGRRGRCKECSEQVTIPGGVQKPSSLSVRLNRTEVVPTETEPPPVAVQVHAPVTVHTHVHGERSSSWGIASLILGVVAICFVCIPIVSIPLMALGLLLGVVGLFSDGGRGFAVAGTCINGSFFALGLGTMLLFGSVLALGHSAAEDMESRRQELLEEQHEQAIEESHEQALDRILSKQVEVPNEIPVAEELSRPARVVPPVVPESDRLSAAEPTEPEDQEPEEAAPVNKVDKAATLLKLAALLAKNAKTPAAKRRAKERLQTIIDDYPDTAAAKEAKRLLLRIN